MSIRPAKAADTLRVLELLKEAHQRSKYADKCEVHDATAKALLLRCVQFHGHTNNGATLYYVSERSGVVEGVFIGCLDRVYHVGTALVAQDIYLYQSERANPRDAVRMVLEFFRWAEVNPRVIEIKFSDSDLIGGNQDQLGRFLQRRGFAVSNKVYTRSIAQMSEAGFKGDAQCQA